MLRNPLSSIALALSLLLPVAATCAAQQSAPPGTEVPGAAETGQVSKLRALTDQLTVDVAKIESLKADRESAAPEDRVLLDRNIRDLELKVGSLVHDLARAVLESKASDPDHERAKALSLEIMEALPPQIEQIIADRKEAVSEASRARDEAAPEDLLAAEQRMTAVSADVFGSMGYYLDHIQLLEQFDQDAANYRTSLAEMAQDFADKTAARVKITNEERNAVTRQLAVSPEHADTKRRKAILDERLKGTLDALRASVDILEGLDLDATQYRMLVVQVTGDISAIGTDVGVVTGLLRDSGRRLTNWLKHNALTIVGRGLIILFILTVFWALSHGARHLVRRVLPAAGTNVSVLARNMLIRVSGNLVLLFGVLVALAQLGISVGPMLAGLGIAGIVVGFALQDTLSNFASGFMILLYRPFDVGDFVQAAGIEGKVRAMNLVSTTILTFDNQTLVVPNNKIWGDVIRNVTSQDKRRVDLVFGIGYDDDLEHAERVFRDILSSHPKVLAEPEMTIKLHELGDSSVNYIVRPWVLKEDYWDVWWDVTREVKRRFDEEGLTIPYPQRDVHVHGTQPAPPNGA